MIERNDDKHLVNVKVMRELIPLVVHYNNIATIEYSKSTPNMFSTSTYNKIRDFEFGVPALYRKISEYRKVNGYELLGEGDIINEFFISKLMQYLNEEYEKHVLKFEDFCCILKYCNEMNNAGVNTNFRTNLITELKNFLKKEFSVSDDDIGVTIKKYSQDFASTINEALKYKYSIYKKFRDQEDLEMRENDRGDEGYALNNALQKLNKLLYKSVEKLEKQFELSTTSILTQPLDSQINGAEDIANVNIDQEQDHQLRVIERAVNALRDKGACQQQ